MNYRQGDSYYRRRKYWQSLSVHNKVIGVRDLKSVDEIRVCKAFTSSQL